MELAILGLLLSTPMHGYELRKQLAGLLGAFRAFSYGSLYPNLQKLLKNELIVETAANTKPTMRRAKRVYAITEKGKTRFTQLMNDITELNFTDDNFSIHLAFFNKISHVTKLKILEGRRRKIEKVRDDLQKLIQKPTSIINRYTKQLNQLKLTNVEQEITWINQIILKEKEKQ